MLSRIKLCGTFHALPVLDILTPLTAYDETVSPSLRTPVGQFFRVTSRIEFSD